MKDWSQHGEQAIVLQFFGDRVGRFLDVGAHAAAENSNTRALMERGWTGLCVEPSPSVFPHLLTNTQGYADIRCLNAAVDDRNRIARFWDNAGDQMSTTEAEHLTKWAGYTFREMYLPTVTFADVLAAFPGPYPFLTIDVEAANLRVLRAAPLIEMGVELVCVERDPDEPVLECLRAMGYGNVRVTQGNYLASRA